MRLAKRVCGIGESVTLNITSRAKKLIKEGIDVVNFAAGEPDCDTPQSIKDAAVKAINSGFTKYTPSSGMPELREAISKKFKVDNSLDYKPSQIVVSNGAKHSLYNVFQAICNPGDEVLIPSPYWLSYPAMVSLAEGESVFIPTLPADNFKITKSSLEAAITKKTKCLILNSPSNPTGSVYDLGELKFIAELAVRYGFFVVSDEIYEKLSYDNRKHLSIAALGKDVYDLTITVNGVSKSYSMTGWRIGYAAGPSDIMEAIANLQSHATSNPSSISQKAALAGLEDGRAFIDKMRGEFEKRRDLMVGGIGRIKNVSCVKPAGAFYVFCDISKFEKSSVEIANRLLDEARVAAIPGAPFGADSFIRLSFATSADEIKKGIERIREWADKNG